MPAVFVPPKILKTVLLWCIRPKSRGSSVNHICDDVETWWNDPELQNAVKDYYKWLALNTPVAIELWATEFQRTATTPGLKVNRAG